MAGSWLAGSGQREVRLDLVRLRRPSFGLIT